MKAGLPFSIGGVAVEEVDLEAVSGGDIAAWFAYDKVMSAESPPLPFEVGRYRVKSLPDFIRLRLFVGRDGDRAIVADGRAMVAQTENNRTICQVHVSVRPDRRRRGIGRSLLDLIVEAAEAEHRGLLVAWTSERVPAGAQFARRVNAEAAHEFHMNRLMLSELPRDTVRAWIEQGPVRAPEYDLISIDGRYPDHLVDAVVDLRKVMTSAPRGRFEMEPPIVSVEQMRKMEQTLLGLGAQRWAIFASHRPTGELVGFTELGFHPSDRKAIQQYGTAVRPEHRGRALGKWLKATLLERLVRERPEAEYVRTGNADSNEAMLAINRQLGFKPWIAATAWQLPIDRARDYLRGAAR